MEHDRVMQDLLDSNFSFREAEAVMRKFRLLPLSKRQQIIQTLRKILRNSVLKNERKTSN
jgi:hypothetical protein